MKDTLNSILILLLDMRNMDSKFHLKRFLGTTVPAEYCILLNPRPEDIDQIRKRYRQQEQPEPDNQCIILSRINNHYPIPPAKAQWIILHGVHCLLIEILGIYFLLSYLDDIEQRYQHDFLIKAGQFSITKNNIIEFPHFLIGYLDHRRYQGLELMNAIDWEYLEPVGDDSNDYMSSFHLLMHYETDIYTPNAVDFVEMENSGPLQDSHSHPIAFHVPCPEENIVKHLLTCMQKDYLPKNS